MSTPVSQNRKTDAKGDNTMHQSAHRSEATQHDPALDSQADAFARELAMLSRKHQIGITGRPVLFVMEEEDRMLAYEVDNESNLLISAA